MNGRWRWRSSIATIGLILTSSGCEGNDGQNADERSLSAPEETAVTTAEGEVSGGELYAVCSPCHGPDGHGTQLAPPLTGAAYIHIDGSRGDLVRLIREGVATPRDYPIPMPPMGGGDFDDAELDLLAAYVESLRSG